MKSSSIKTQNNQVMPAGSRLWTPFDLGNLLIGYHSYKSFANNVDETQPQFWHDLTGNVSLQQDTLSNRPIVRASSNIGDLPALGFGDGAFPPTVQFMTDTSANLPNIGAGDFFVAGVIRPQTGGPFFSAYTNEVAFGLTNKTILELLNIKWIACLGIQAFEILSKLGVINLILLLCFTY